MVNLRNLYRSFSYALTGIAKVFHEEQNFRIHIVSAVIVFICGILLKIALWEWIIIIMLIALMLMLEIFNSIIERFLDLFKPRLHQYVKDIKDLGAALVLLGAICSALIGLLVFLPKILEIFFKLTQ